MRGCRALNLLFCLSPVCLAQTWKEYNDPIERAFTVDVPQGWTAKGGLFRLGYSDYRPMIDLKSADSRTNIRLGDLSIPTYAIPNQFHSREGDIVDLGAQAQETVARYRSGQEFAEMYGRARFRDVCRSLRLQPAAAEAPVKKQPEPAGALRVSDGQALYQCDTAQGPRVAYVYTRTVLYQGFWQAPAIASFITTPDRVAETRAILLHGSQSFALAAQWIQYQRRMDDMGLQYQIARQQGRRQALAQQVQEFQAQMQSMRNQVSAFERRQDAQASQVASWGNVLTGVTPTIDPLTGASHQVWTGAKSGYWINGRGETVNSDVSPGAGWRQLQQ